MLNFREWTWARWSVLATILSAIVLLGGTITAGEKIAGYVPLATKGYVVLIVDQKLLPLLQSIEDYGDLSQQDRLGNLELRLTVLTNTQLSIAQSLSATPNDFNLKRMERDVARDIRDTESEIRELKCQMRILRC